MYTLKCSYIKVYINFVCLRYSNILHAGGRVSKPLSLFHITYCMGTSN